MYIAPVYSPFVRDIASCKGGGGGGRALGRRYSLGSLMEGGGGGGKEREVGQCCFLGWGWGRRVENN